MLLEFYYPSRCRSRGNKGVAGAFRSGGVETRCSF